MKIIAVGMNYAAHNQELHAGMALPKEPVIFLKPDSAMLKDGKPFFIPDFSNEIHYETELVVRISRLGKNISERFAHRYYDAVTGQAVINQFIQIAANQWAYLNQDGHKVTGLQNINNKVYYFGSNGAQVKGKLLTVQGKKS